MCVLRELFEMFCPNCKCLLFPKDGVPTCSKCGYKEKADRREGSVVTKKNVKLEVAVLAEAGSTLPTDDAECPKCGNKKAYWVLRQMRGADEPETRIFRCVKCSHSWRESA